MTIKSPPSALPDLPDIALSCDGILNRQYHLYQPKKGYRFGTDAIMLAAAVGTHYGTRIADFGAGAGAVTTALCHFLESVHVTAIEKDPEMADCLAHNMALNHLDERVRVMRHDITHLPSLLQASFDCVVANPPFHHASGTRSRHHRRALAHQGDDANLTDWVGAALALLKPKGRFVMIVRADRTDEVITALKDKQAGQITLQPLWPYGSSPAIRVIISAQKQSKAPFAILQGLVLHHPDGVPTQRAAQILNGEGAGALAMPDKNDAN